jgi:D-galactarolactone cycloisomerase
MKTAIDTSFQIEKIESWHLKFDGGYWEEYKRDSGGVKTARFEFHPGWQTVYASSVEVGITRVTLADGSQGWGEPNTTIGPEVYCLILKNLIAQMVEGREYGSPVELWDFLYDAQRGRGYLSGFWLDALAGLDIAVWDAIGKREKMPVHQMFGRPIRESMPAYLSGIRRAKIEERISYGNEWVDRGLTGAKIFLDGDVNDGLKELEALKAGVPGIEKWMVDVLWMLRGDNGPAAKQAFGDLGAIFLECPLQPEDLDGHRALWQEPGAPLALGEHFRTSYQLYDWVSGDRALDIYQPDIGRTGISDGLRQLDQAWNAGLDATIHMGSGSAIFQAATFAVSAVCKPTHLQEYQAGLTGKTGDAVRTSWKYADGKISISEEPGLGIDVNIDELESFVVR